MRNRLYEELGKSEKVQVKYAVDENAEGLYSELDVRSMDDDLEDVDAIVVTAVFDFENIKTLLEQKTNCTIVSLEDVVFGI